LKAQIESLLKAAIAGLQAEGGLPHDVSASVEVDHTRSKEHGDFACNVALALAKAARAKPRDPDSSISSRNKTPTSR
jgi:arginyl-tRNA synthetase